MKHRSVALRLRLRRLTADSRMEFVWRQLERELTNISRGPRGLKAHRDLGPAFVEASLRGYLIAALNADMRAAYWAKAPGAQEQRTIMRGLRDHASALLELLGDPTAFESWTAWDPLTVAISLSEAPTSPNHVLVDRLLDRLARDAYGRRWSQGKEATVRPNRDVRDGTSFPSFPRDARMLLGDLPSQLTALAVLADIALAQTLPKPPHKTMHMRQTVYVRDLARIIQAQGLRPRQNRERQAGFPLFQILATTANVALALSGTSALQADTVRRLVL